MTQVLANALVSTAGYLIVGIGLSLVYTTCRFFHIAHGVVFTAAAYATYLLRVSVGLPLALAVVGGLFISTLLGVAIETSVYRPLRKRAAGGASVLLASLGVYTAIQACLTLAFGSGTRTFRIDGPAEGMCFLGARVTDVQLATVLLALALFALTVIAASRTRIGSSLRAVGSNPQLAVVCGLSPDRVMLVAMAVASALAGVAGILVSADSGMTPTMGFRLLLMAMIAMIAGGGGSLYGIALGSVILATLQHLSSWWISSRWQDAIAFGFLLLLLSLRADGCLRKPRMRGGG